METFLGIKGFLKRFLEPQKKSHNLGFMYFGVWIQDIILDTISNCVYNNLEKLEFGWVFCLKNIYILDYILGEDI